jgi:hypothetical protein
MNTRNKFTSLLPILVLIVSAGCRTISTQNLQSFSAAVSTAKLQSDQAFNAVNGLTNSAVIDYAAAQPTLKDENFVVVLDQASIGKWDDAFAQLVQYSQKLATLTSGSSSEDFQNAMVGLGTQINTTGQTLQSANLIGSAPNAPPGLAAGFTKLGGLLLSAKAESDAKKIATKADPGIQDVLNGMADQIGNSPSDGIRGTVSANWTLVKAGQKVAFLKATSAADKRTIAAAYAQLLIQQGQQDMALADLERSLRALAQAHHALASGSDLDVTSAIQTLNTEASDTNALYNKFNAIKKSPGE